MTNATIRNREKQCFGMQDPMNAWQFRGTLGAIALTLTGAVVSAETAEQEFKRSLQESMDAPVDPTKLVAFVLAMVALILAAVVFNKWRAVAGRPRSTRALNSPGKLIREICKGVNLRPVEIKQLRVLCDQQNIASPLVMLLCPSVLGKAVKENQKRIDRSVLGALAKKISRRA